MIKKKIKRQLNEMFKEYRLKYKEWTEEQADARLQIIKKHMLKLRELTNDDIELDDLFNS